MHATAMFVGDAVIISPEADEDDTTNTNYYPKIRRSTCADGAVVIGCIVSFDADPDNLTYQYRPASTERIANVCMDPTVVYQIRGCGQGTPATDWIWRNAIGADSSGSTVTGLSGMKLDEGTATAPTNNQSNPFLIVGVAAMPDNTLADYAIWEVMLNTTYNTTGLILGITDT